MEYVCSTLYFYAGNFQQFYGSRSIGDCSKSKNLLLSSEPPKESRMNSTSVTFKKTSPTSITKSVDNKGPGIVTSEIERLNFPHYDNGDDDTPIRRDENGNEPNQNKWL